MVGNRFNIESAPGFVNILSWTKSFRPAQCGKQPLPGATIGVLSVFLVRMMNSRLGVDWRDQLALLAPAGHPLAHAARVRFAQALEHPMVGLKPGSTLHSRLLRAAAELGRSLPMQVQVGSFDAMCAMIAAGMGVGIMPRAASLPYLDALRLTATPLDESWAEHQLYLCRKADGELSPAAARLFAHLAAQASPA